MCPQLLEKFLARLSETQVQLSSGSLNRCAFVSLKAGGSGGGWTPRKAAEDGALQC